MHTVQPLQMTGPQIMPSAPACQGSRGPPTQNALRRAYILAVGRRTVQQPGAAVQGWYYSCTREFVGDKLAGAQGAHFARKWGNASRQGMLQALNEDMGVGLVSCVCVV